MTGVAPAMSPSAGLAEYPLNHASGASAALAAFAVILAHHLGEDRMDVQLRASDAREVLRVDLSANPSARALASAADEALRAVSVDRDDAFPLVAIHESASGTLGLRVDGDDAPSLTLLADADSAAGMERLAARMGELLGEMAADPARGALEWSPLTAAEWEERVRWNATAAPLPHGVCLHEAFEAHADADPHAIAVLYDDESITYGEVEARANRLAHHLRRAGVGPESRVGICVERGPRVIEAILGILKAGGAYVPLDPTYPPERLARMGATAGVRVLVTEEGPGAALAAGEEAVFLDRDAAAIAAESDARPVSGAGPENLAYVIFTSGSTGEPKGIALAHRGVMNNLADLNGRHGVGPADRVLLLSSLSFDMSVYETLGILAAGGAVVIPQPHELRDPAAWAALCRRHGVTLWNSAPALLGMLCEYAEAHPADAPRGLRLAFLGGDWVPVPLVDRVRRWAPEMRDFIVMGGATEASIHSIIQPVGEVDPAWRSIPYGVPMANQQAYVLDEHLRPVLAGTAGELFLGGIGLARGYTGRAGFTAERFLPAPGQAGARIYRTGDRARYGADGTIELLGRIDHQVKIRGFRIEPGEVEAALRRHPAITRAVVTARADGGEARLVAYLLLAEGAHAPEPRELRARLAETLPDYMVPSAFVVLDRLPLSPNGKVDRRQLPAPPAEAERAPWVAPRTPAEAALAAIWGEVLGVARVGAHDDFFALGGQSLQAARALTRIREAFGAGMTVRALFESPTVAELAARLESASAQDEPGEPPLPRAEGVLPLSFAQERLWFLDRLQPESAFYNIATALRLSGPLRVDALERALSEIVRRHEPLRTRFPLAGGAPVQEVMPFAGLPLVLHDAGRVDDEAAARRWAEAEAARPFDLAAGPPFRAALLRMDEDEHLLLLTMHHAVGDGWSTGVLFRELAALYGAFGDGRPSPLPEPAARYADYAVWQRGQLRGAAVERQLAYWRERLAGVPERMEMATDHPRPAAQSYRGARAWLDLPPELADGLVALARREGVSLYMVLLGAFQLLLGRRGAGPDVVVGSPVAGRTRRDTEEMIGFFANTLALRTDLSGDPAFGEVLRRVRTAALGAFEHQDVPFERLVEELRPERSLGHAPLVQVLFALQDNDRSPALAGLRVREVEVDLGTTRSDLVLQIAPRGGALRCELEYALDLFRPATAARMLRQLRRVLEQVAADPSLPVSRVELMDAAERRAVVAGVNPPPADYPRDAGIAALFAEQAAAAPDALAVRFGAESLAYGQLDARANRLARHLAALGVGTETRVGICLERGVEMVVAMLAVLKAGGAYVPLDPGYPADRLSFMLADAGVAALVTRDGLRASVPIGGEIPVVCVDGDRERIGAESADPVDGGAGAGSLAYVIYTSGSTGTPRGVAVEHRGVVRLVRGTDYVRLGPDDRVGHASNVSFDAATFEVWGALLNGAALVVLGSDEVLAPARLAAAVAERGITTMFLTTALFNQVARELPGAFRPMRTLLVGGEALDAGAVRRVLRAGGPARLLNAYGPTECTTFSTWHRVDGVDEDARTVPIGRSVAHSTAYVLDRGALAPPGVPGELHLGGDGVARGYLGRPALTAEKFVPDPFSAHPGARLYRTGDLVRWMESAESGRLSESDRPMDSSASIQPVEANPSTDSAGSTASAPSMDVRASTEPNTSTESSASTEYLASTQSSASTEFSASAGFSDAGGWVESTAISSSSSSTNTGDGEAEGEGRGLALEFLARVDGQVKIRGFRIEPGEVEAALRGLPGVADCTVTVREDVPGERRLVAYVAGAADAEGLRAGLRRTLPEYMVPSAFVPVAAIPLTPNGKVDRAALPAPAAAPADDWIAPRTPAEEVLAAIWADVLRVDRVGARDNFFDLGGHSLLATRVVSRIREVFGAEVPVRVLFEAPTLAALAERVEEARRAERPRREPVAALPRTGPMPLSAAQERLWFLDRMRPGLALYNVPLAVRLHGPLRVDALEHALGEIIRRHEALRTTFAEVDGAPVQRAVPFAGFRVPVESVDGDDAERWIARRVAEDAEAPFDLEAGPLIRATLLRVSADDHVLLLNLHHIVSDGWSLDVLFRELAALYAGTAPAALPVQYADFAAWERAHLRGEGMDAALAWWTRRLAGAPPLLALPTDRPRPAVQTYRGAREPFALPAELAEGLRALARAEGATPYMLLVAAFQVLLARYTGGTDIVVGTAAAGRTRAEVEGLIGLFVNTLVLRTDLSGDPEFREALRRVREVTLGAYEHQDLPFDRLVEALQPERSLSYAPLFQVMVVQEGDGGGAALEDLRVQRLPSDNGTSKFDLTLAVSAEGDGVHGAVEYSTDLFDRGTILRMLDHLSHVLRQAATDPALRLSQLELAGEEERRRVVDEWNRTSAPYPTDACIHQLFEQQAARTPDAVAVVCENDSLTYAQLNARANRIAHHLRALGAGAESRVGVCLRRGPQMLVALLGVLKAGAAYVPLDPAYPVERLRFTLDDAGVAVLVTQDELRALLPVADGIAVVSLDGDAARIASRRDDDPPHPAGPGGLAYLIYTSGSTGTPKGVAIEHRAAVALLSWAATIHTAEELSGMLAATSICFDLSVYELFLPLSRGGTVIITDNALALPRSAAADRVRLVNTVPSAISALLDSGGIPAGVTTVNLAGEPLRAELADALYAAGIQRVIDLYGPSESTTYSTWIQRVPGGPATIGRPIANTRAYVLDGGLRLVPGGVVGELYLAGHGLARGYLGRPGMTADRFVPDPFSTAPGGRMYRTGDRVRWMTEGTLEFLGRLDGQVKVRGYRIELGEIEAALRRQDGLADCVVVVRPDERGEPRLAAYVAGTARPDEVRDGLRRALPAYMVPSSIVALDRLPLTPSGKVDRAALPAPEHAPADEPFVAPASPVEEVLAGICAEVLGRERVGVRDNFFRIGGHSLLAMRVVARIREVLDGEITVVTLFENPTVDALARVVSARAPASSAAAASAPAAWSGDADASPHAMMASIGGMSEEEVDRLLAETLDDPDFE